MQPISSFSLVLLGVLSLALAIPLRVAALELPGSDQLIEQSWIDSWQQSSKDASKYVNRLVLSGSELH